jgi:hypothetical protein
MIICLVYIGKVPLYARYCVQQIRYYTQLPIYFITDDIQNASMLLHGFDVKYVNPSELNDKNIEELNTLKKYFSETRWIRGREELFFTSFLRLYLLENFMRKYNINDVFHLEVDNLIYSDPSSFNTIFSKKGISYLYEDKGRGCASIFFAKDVESLNHMNNTILEYVDMNGGFNSEMHFLGRYAEEYEDRVNVLPHVPPEENNTTVSKISENFEFVEQMMGKNWIFDSMSIGMWISGIDRIHSGGMIKRCKSPWITLDITNCKYEWKTSENGKKYLVMITKSGKECIIFNLHIHSKDLQPYMSM